mmetsp:Transcript_961/g.2290  ORF Transcript_961/g.2290 Transcript_961/m.2290 type:complete len:174 (-) Transcript_961:96-617(-)
MMDWTPRDEGRVRPSRSVEGSTVALCKNRRGGTQLLVSMETLLPGRAAQLLRGLLFKAAPASTAARWSAQSHAVRQLAEAVESERVSGLLRRHAPPPAPAARVLQAVSGACPALSFLGSLLTLRCCFAGGGDEGAAPEDEQQGSRPQRQPLQRSLAEEIKSRAVSRIAETVLK